MSYDDIGSRPQKFRLKNKKHAFEQSPYNSTLERSPIANSFQKIVVPHDLYQIPKVSSKITNVPAPSIYEADPFYRPLAQTKNDKISVKLNQTLGGQQQLLETQKSPTMKSALNSINTTFDFNNSDIPSYTANGKNQIVDFRNPHDTNFDDYRPNESSAPQHSRSYLYEEANNYSNKNEDNYNARVLPIGNYNDFGHSKNNDYHHRVKDSLDLLQTEVNELKNNPNQMKGTLEKFYGMQGSDYNIAPSIHQKDYSKANLSSKNQLPDNFYNSVAGESKSTNDFSYGKMLKSLLRLTSNGQETHQKPLNPPYASYSFAGSLEDFSSPSHKHNNHSLNSYELNQKPNLNANSNSPFTLDPITHKKIYCYNSQKSVSPTHLSGFHMGNL